MGILSMLELQKLAYKLSKKYKIEILSFTGERVRLKSVLWEKQPELLADIRALLETVPEVKSVRVTPEIGTVTIEFTTPKQFPFETIKKLETELDELHRKNGVFAYE
jgi:hypothetical protein